MDETSKIEIEYEKIENDNENDLWTQKFQVSGRRSNSFLFKF
jgi:hypothetical protein